MREIKTITIFYKKDQGKLLLFTKDRDAANNIFYTAINHLKGEDEDEDLY